MLLHYGAEVDLFTNPTNSQENFPSRTEGEYNPEELKKLLADGRMTALHLASYFGSFLCMKILLTHKADSKILSKGSLNSVLHFGVIAKHEAIVKFLLNKEKHLLVQQNSDEKTPL